MHVQYSLIINIPRKGSNDIKDFLHWDCDQGKLASKANYLSWVAPGVPLVQ